MMLMKKAESSLVIVGVVAVAAVIGLVLSASNPSSTGAAVAGDVIQVEGMPWLPGDGDACLDGYRMVECRNFDYATGMCGLQFGRDFVVVRCGLGCAVSAPSTFDCAFGECGFCQLPKELR